MVYLISKKNFYVLVPLFMLVEPLSACVLTDRKGGLTKAGATNSKLIYPVKVILVVWVSNLGDIKSFAFSFSFDLLHLVGNQDIHKSMDEFEF